MPPTAKPQPRPPVQQTFTSPPPPVNRTPAPPPPSAGNVSMAPGGSFRLPTNDDPPVTGLKIALIGTEGYGKTSLAAYAPGMTMMLHQLETGYLTLRNENRVPKVPYTICDTWEGTMSLLDYFEKNGCSPWLGLDALGGFERMCHEFCCRENFKGDWGEKGFMSFQKGYSVGLTYWLEFLRRLENIAKMGTNILILSHYRMGEAPNPMGADFSRYTADVFRSKSADYWSPVNRWADDVFFGTFYTVTQDIQKKTIGIGGEQRVLYTERRDAFDAKNKHGMEPMIFMPGRPEEMFSTLWAAMGKE